MYICLSNLITFLADLNLGRDIFKVEGPASEEVVSDKVSCYTQVYSKI